MYVAPDKSTLSLGKIVLINRASGSVGTFTLQMVKAIGVEVTAVFSMGNSEMARSLGAEHFSGYNLIAQLVLGDQFWLKIW